MYDSEVTEENIKRSLDLIKNAILEVVLLTNGSPTLHFTIEVQRLKTEP